MSDSFELFCAKLPTKCHVHVSMDPVMGPYLVTSWTHTRWQNNVLETWNNRISHSSVLCVNRTKHATIKKTLTKKKSTIKLYLPAADMHGSWHWARYVLASVTKLLHCVCVCVCKCLSVCLSSFLYGFTFTTHLMTWAQFFRLNTLVYIVFQFNFVTKIFS